MARLVFIRRQSGEKYEIEAACGQTLTEAAAAHNIQGVIGECGGVCACGTCHVYLEEAIQKNLPPAAIMEEDMLSFMDKRRPASRLACQITVSEAMDGMTIIVP